MSETVGDDLVARLVEWGVDTIFGYPGDGINGFIGALGRGGERIRFVQTRHEEMAAFMACAWAKYTGKVGVCTATSGPGAIHLLNGLYDAKLDHQPVVAIVGQTNVAAMGGDQQQEVDLLTLFKDVASAYVQQVNTPGALHHCLDRALRIADAEHTVTAVIIPADVQEMKAVPLQPKGVKAIHSGVGYVRSRIVPSAAAVDRAADLLNAGNKVAILVGAGALDATDEVMAVADVLGAGIAKALLGKAAVPDEVPFCTGSIGLLGTKPSWAMMQRCDTLLVIGSGFPYSNFLPPVGQARAIQIDHAARAMSLRYPMDVLLCGDSKATLTALLPRLRRQPNRSWRNGIVDDVKELVGAHGQTRRARTARRPNPPTGAVRSAVAAAPRQRDAECGFGKRRNLVCATRATPARHESDALRWSGNHAPRRSLRNRRQIRLSRSCCHCFGR